MTDKKLTAKKVLAYLVGANWTRILVTILLIYVAYEVGSSGRAPAESSAKGAPVSSNAAAGVIWTCSMHPQIKMPEPGACPICGMDLIELKSSGDDAGPRALVMSKSDMALAQVQTSRVERRFVESTIRMVGKVVYDETRVKSLSAWIPGRLDRLFVDYTGTRVEKGDHMVLLYSPQLLEAQESLLEARKSLEETANEKSEFLKNSAKKHLESEREKLRLWGLTSEQIAAIEERGEVQTHIQINAPLSGVVIHKKAVEGMYVKVGSPIYTVADLSVVWLELDAYEMDFPWIRYGQKVQIETEAHPGEKFDGWISFVPPYLDEKTRTKKIRVNVANKDLKLKPGMFVRAVLRSKIAEGGQVLEPDMAKKWICPMHHEVVKDEEGICDICKMVLVPATSLGFSAAKTDLQPPIVVPSTAVLLTGKRGVVYVQRPDTERPTFEGREVVVGPRAGDWYLIYDGLKEGEMVVTNGNFKIDSALQILAKPSMMSMTEEADASRMETTPEFLEALERVYQGYFEAQVALTKDDVEAAKMAMSMMTKEAKNLAVTLANAQAHERWNALSAEIVRATEHLKHAQKIASVRGIFEVVSKSILAVERSFGHRGKAVHREAFCPMAAQGKGASWLQLAESVENPFYGSSMFTCGEIREEFAGADGKPVMKSKDKSDAGKADSNGMKVSVGRDFLAATAPIYGAYFQLHKALSSDDLEAAKTAMTAINTAVKSFPQDLKVPGNWDNLSQALLAKTAHGPHASDIKSARKMFNEIAPKILEMENSFGHPGKTTYHTAFCSMANGGKGGTWLQVSDEVENPFYGSSMFSCGEIKSTHMGEGK